MVRIFDWGRAKPQIIGNDVIKIFRKNGLFMDKKKKKKKKTLDFAKGEGLEPNVKNIPKLSKLGDVLSKLV